MFQDLLNQQQTQGQIHNKHNHKIIKNQTIKIQQCINQTIQIQQCISQTIQIQQ